MNWDRIDGEWKQLTARVKSKWAKLTDDDVKNAGAKKDALIGKIQERYGMLRDEAERQVDEWTAKLPPRGRPASVHPARNGAARSGTSEAGARR